MTIYDAFPFHDELDLLEMRLYELESIPNLKHILVEATVTHQDNPKPLYFADNRERFAPWADRIIHVVADVLPTVDDDPDPWARELAQRTYITKGLGDAQPDDILLQSDVDEIPHPLVVRNLRLHPGSGFVAFRQRGHFWAVDWEYPPGWSGTVAVRVGDSDGNMPRMRSMRNLVRQLGQVQGGRPTGGWHFSWLGGRERAIHKVGAFCHPEVEERIVRGLDEDTFLRHGWHVDGVRMRPVEVDKTWPKYIVEGKAPPEWFRKR